MRLVLLSLKIHLIQKDNDGAQNTDGYFAVERLSSGGSWVTHYSDFDWETEVSFRHIFL